MPNKITSHLMSEFLRYSNLKIPPIASFKQQKITLTKPNKFFEKFSNIRNHPKQLQFIADFDYTITKYRHNNRQCDSLFGMWSNSTNILPQKFRQTLISIYREFGPYQTDATISFEQRVHLVGQFYKFQTKAFEKFQITLQMAENVLNHSYLVYRHYTNQLLNILQLFNIPLYIISGGISDSISNSIYALTRKQFNNISIHSNQLEQYTNTHTHDGNTLIINNLIKFHKQLVHSYNKYKVMNHVKKRRNCLLMGDLISDIYMAEGNNYQNVLSIFYAKEGENHQRTQAQRKFDIIVQGDSSHKIIIELVKAINCPHQIDWKYLESTQSKIHQLLI